MKEEALKDFGGKIIGWIRTDEATGDQKGYQWDRWYVGEYRASQNVTKDWRGVVRYQGNMLSALIDEANRKGRP